jgi:ABC-type cobalamin/Fe3+-siderophores transport system ATPase subunit
MTRPRLAAHALGFGYDATPVGRNVDIDVRPGEVLCLLGPNGSDSAAKPLPDAT